MRPFISFVCSLIRFPNQRVFILGQDRCYGIERVLFHEEVKDDMYDVTPLQCITTLQLWLRRVVMQPQSSEKLRTYALHALHGLTD